MAVIDTRAMIVDHGAHCQRQKPQRKGCQDRTHVRKMVTVGDFGGGMSNRWIPVAL